jgi:hypothetical protein
MAAKTHTVKMQQDKDTKGAVRFAATEDDQPITQLYVRKPAGSELGDKISVTVKAES